MLKLKLQYFGHLMQRADSLEKTLMLGKIEGKRRREWQRMNGWVASLTQQTWVWASSKRLEWRTGKPGVLQFMGWLRASHDLEIKQQQQGLQKTRPKDLAFGAPKQKVSSPSVTTIPQVNKSAITCLKISLKICLFLAVCSYLWESHWNIIVGEGWIWKREAKQSEKKKDKEGWKEKKRNLEKTKTKQKAEENCKITFSSEKYEKKKKKKPKNKALWGRTIKILQQKQTKLMEV